MIRRRGHYKVRQSGISPPVRLLRVCWGKKGKKRMKRMAVAPSIAPYRTAVYRRGRRCHNHPLPHPHHPFLALPPDGGTTTDG